MSDRLAASVVRAHDFQTKEWLGVDGLPSGVLYERAAELADDVLALVEVAKAARETDRVATEAFGPPDSLDYTDTFSEAHRKLRAALSALDGEEGEA